MIPSGANPISGVYVNVVEPGHVVEFRGEKRPVTDEEAVFAGNDMYVTQKVWDALQAAIP